MIFFFLPNFGKNILIIEFATKNLATIFTPKIFPSVLGGHLISINIPPLEKRRELMPTIQELVGSYTYKCRVMPKDHGVPKMRAKSRRGPYFKKDPTQWCCLALRSKFSLPLDQFLYLVFVCWMDGKCPKVDEWQQINSWMFQVQV